MKYMVGNWKMNHTKKEVLNFLTEMKDFAPFKCQSWIAPQSMHFYLFKQYGLELGIEIGAQNCSEHESGAYTGELSAPALLAEGVSFVLLGHSERRQYFAETSSSINLKIKTALKNKLKVIYCIGETLAERQANQTFKIIEAQLKDGLQGIEHGPDLLLAYEPVWAIGTGQTASPEQAQEVHQFIRAELGKIWNTAQAKATPVLYGGSVKPDNVAELLKQSDIDGGLVGGASLKSKDFAVLCQVASQFGA